MTIINLIETTAAYTESSARENNHRQNNEAVYTSALHGETSRSLQSDRRGVFQAQYACGEKMQLVTRQDKLLRAQCWHKHLCTDLKHTSPQHDVKPIGKRSTEVFIVRYLGRVWISSKTGRQAQENSLKALDWQR